MHQPTETLIRRLAQAAIIGAALAPALVYLATGYSGARQLVLDDANIQRIRATSVISQGPDTWMYVSERLADQIEQVRHKSSHTEIIDAQGVMVLELGEECDSSACISEATPLLDFGKRVGTLTVKFDLTPVLSLALAIGIGGLAIGALLLSLLDKYVIRRLEKVKEANLELAFYDPLTRLPNRRLLLDRLGQAVAASKRNGEYGAVMILDLDNFKVLNDSQGHDAGDRLLIAVGQRITALLRQEDTVSRLGGDEFVVIVESLGESGTYAAARAESIAEKIRRGFGQPFVVSNMADAYHTTPSIGVTLFRGTEVSIEALLKQADVALYQAKDAGRNIIRFFNPDMQAAIDYRADLEMALRKGLEQGEFQLYYQPKVDVNGTMFGAEALLRWLPKGRPQVSPAHFIPLAEESGFIVQMGNWVLDTACAQLKSWESGPFALLTISINVSTRQFMQDDFVDQICRTLLKYNINPARLQLELTESVVADRIDLIIDRMQRIRRLGIGFSLDDFGTGYSSLTYLKKLPLDQIKIDQSFVRDLMTDPNDAAIVTAIIAMSRSLGFDVIAEGVETDAQRDFLKESGCLNYQGFLFGKPMPVGEFAQLALPRQAQSAPTRAAGTRAQEHRVGMARDNKALTQ